MDVKNTDRIRVTLDCQIVNREIYTIYESIPTTEMLQHQLKGSDRFTTLGMTNCYLQFEIDEDARKLFVFHTPWGIFQYKHMVTGISPASSEIQKKIRELTENCTNAVHIKDERNMQHNIAKECNATTFQGIEDVEAQRHPSS